MTAHPTIEIALYQPDIPGNTGTILRFAACLGARVHVIEPAGFDLSDKALKRAGMDYLETAALRRHVNWTVFNSWRTGENRRLVLLTTRAETAYTAHDFRDDEILLFGRESAGVPEAIREAVDARLTIPMADGARSINLALSVAMAAGEAMRQRVWSR